GEINLAWSAPSDDGQGVKPLMGGYIIKYSSVQIINSSNFNAPAFAHGSVIISTSGVAPDAAVGYTLSLTPGASYWFAIKSTDTAGNLSVWKSSADVPTVNTAAYGWAYDAAPAAPANLAATASDNSVMLTWDAVAAADLSHYELFYSSTAPYDFSDNLVATATVNTTFTHTGLEDHVTHYYKVRAVDLPPSVLYGAFSNIVSTFPQPSAPFAPSLSYDLTATTTDSIKWMVTDNAANETGLHISSAANTGARLWSSAGLASTGGTTSWIETGFGANEAVTRYAEASNAVGSAWSGSLTRYTRSLSPSTLAADAVYFSSVTLSWSANGNLGSPKYEISISSDKFSVFFATPIALAANHTAVTADITGLVQGATYWVRARAYNGDSIASVFSSTMNLTTDRVATQYLKVANQGFELTPNLSGWSKEGVTPSSTLIDRSVTQKRSGSYSCKMDNPTADYNARRILSSSSTIVAGNNYSVGAWFYINLTAGAIGDTQIRIGMRWIDNTNTVIYTSTSADLNLSAFGGWEKLSYSDVAPANAVAAVMSIAVKETIGNDNDVYIDDVDYRPDTIAPGAITDLAAVKGANPGEINLAWTAVGDDAYAENNGASAVYTLRYATYPMVASSSWTWRNNAVVYYQAWPVAALGATANRTLSLSPGVTYHFLIRTQDAAGNVSEFDTNSLVAQSSACAKEGVIGGVRINEVAPDQTAGQLYDFIELYNPGPDTPNILGWEFFDYYTQDTYLEKVEGNWNFPANSYLVLRAATALTRNMTTPVTVSANHYELISNKAGFSQTDNVIVITTGGVNATVLDAVCYADMSGSLTNSTRLRAAYNAAISTGQWFGPLADGANDATVERYMASSLYNTSSNWAIARNNLSTDGTNPSYMEWAMNHTATRGGSNGAFDATPPAAVGNLAVVPGANRGTMRVTWTAVGDDSNTGAASGYLLKTRTDLMTGDNFDSSANYAFTSKEGQSDTDRWAPKASGQAESYLIGGFDAGTTYFVGLKVQDERPNSSALSNVVSTMAANVIGSNVRINEIATLTASADWVEFYCGTGPVNVNGWQILSIVTGGASETTFKTLPDITLQTGDYLVYNCVAGTDETNASGKGVNGYWDVYGVNDPDGFRGVVTLKDNFANIVDFLAYSQGTAPTWGPIWASAAAWKQWAPSAAAVADAADWAGGDASKSLGRNSFSDDTDDTAAAKNDWKIYLVPTKGAQNDDVPPGAVTNLSALADSAIEGKITLTWTAPGDDGIVGNNSGGYYMVKYATYSVETSSLAWWNSISTTTASSIAKGWKIKSPPSAVGLTETQILTGLYPATTYYFAVRAVDDVANWSALDLQLGAADPAVQAQAIVTNLAPAAPTGVTAVSSNTAAMLSWSANTEPDLKEYIISKNTVNDFADGGTSLVAVVSSAAARSYTDGGLANGVTYYFWIQAKDTFGLTGSTSATVSAYPIITPPSGLAAAHKGSWVELSWVAAPDYASTNFAGYAIYRSSVSASSDFNLLTVLTGGGAATHYDTSSVSATQTYYYFLRSSDTAGPESAATSVVTAVPDDKGPVITAISPSANTVRVAVKGSKIVIEAVIADDATTPYISGVNSGTVSIAYTTSTSVGATYLALDIVAGSASYDGARLLGATFRKELTAATAGISAPLQNILTNGGTFYFIFYAQDNVVNYTVGSALYTAYIQSEPKTVAAVTAAAGGTVALTDGNPDDGETSVAIPVGALKGDTSITVEQKNPAAADIAPAVKEPTIDIAINGGKPVAVYHFGPAGTVFAKPVTLTLLYFEEGNTIKNIAGDAIAAAREDDLRIYWWDGVEWRYVGGTVDKTKNTVSAKVSHFSLYALFASKGAPAKPSAMEKFVTPNGDGFNDTLQFDGSSDDFKEITIYDINGKIIRKLESVNIWDAKDENGKVVEIGAYIWRAVYMNGTANYGTVVVAK
ncbi:MAG: gliding motility-associated C-terminal domain-containing protein, partial [Endomicrobiia bacterium]|nr:gliding motility-associated C-terminal domain-containing protein [Endomicrobiia bacterium]